MIDAYEIGIQLLLQEDVSPGLAVINRGLAEVDQAIAATSADLVGLVQKAETATKAVAAALNARPVQAAALDQDKYGEPERAVAAPSNIAGVVSPIANQGGNAAVPEAEQVEAPAAAAAPASTPPKSEQPLPPEAAREATVSSVAPVNSSAVEAAISDQRSETVQSDTRPIASIAPAEFVPTPPRARDSTPIFNKEPARVGEAREPRRSVTPSSSQLALTASVNRAGRPATPGTQSERAQHKATAGPTARRERPAAPWSGMDQSGAQAESTRLHNRTAAPRSAGQDRGEIGGGTVMLDGRLVGQWLSEHMAREASRPPAGTSFFDPRQTPAWTVSGVL